MTQNLYLSFRFLSGYRVMSPCIIESYQNLIQDDDPLRKQGEMRKSGRAEYPGMTLVYLAIDLDNSCHHGAFLAGFLPAGK
jgi:hypothetical protein